MSRQAPAKRIVRPTKTAKKAALGAATKKTRSSRRPDQAAAPSKLDLIVAALRSSKGATLAALMKLTGWQMHSVRGALAGALKKRRGIVVTSTKTGAERVYRIEAHR